MRIVSFDPGKSTSWARYDTTRPDLMEVGDVEMVGVGRLARPCAVHILDLISEADLVLVEEVSTRPGEGTVSAFTFGMAFGVILGTVQGGKKPLRTVTPKQWSVLLRLKPGKGDSDKKAAALALAKETWPCLREELKLVKDHNRADAALMIRWFVEHGPGRETS